MMYQQHTTVKIV